MTPPTSTFDILGLCGSLRERSLNRGLLQAARELAPAGVRVTVANLEGVPWFNEDVEARGTPAVVQALKARITGADGLLIATPEYNYGLPGWFKNVLDWLLRPPATTPLKHKPVALLGASVGPRGTARAQMALRQTLVYADSYAMARPELFVGPSAPLFDQTGTLTDEATREQLRQLLAAFLDWIRLVGGR